MDSESAGRHPNQLRPTQHHISRPGSYFSLEGDLSIAYGDGTPESLAEALRREPERDPWQPQQTPWGATHSSWTPMAHSAEPSEPGAGEPDTTSVSEATGSEEEQ